jgi:predicted nucleic acid-binding protein
VPVVDASVVVDWVAPDVDPGGPAMAALEGLVERDERVIGPRLLLEEVANALLTGVRRGRWDGAAADRAFDDLRALPVALVDTHADVEAAWDLSRRYDEHPIYDLVYVALARRLGDTLITADRRLAERIGSREIRLIGETQDQ